MDRSVVPTSADVIQIRMDLSNLKNSLNNLTIFQLRFTVIFMKTETKIRRK